MLSDQTIAQVEKELNSKDPRLSRIPRLWKLHNLWREFYKHLSLQRVTPEWKITFLLLILEEQNAN